MSLHPLLHSRCASSQVNSIDKETAQIIRTLTSNILQINKRSKLSVHVELVANNLAAKCVKGSGLVTFKVRWQAGSWVGEYRGGRGTNASMTLRGRTCDCESPSDEGQLRGEEGTKERDSRSRGTHDQMEMCLDENEFLRSGQFKYLKL